MAYKKDHQYESLAEGIIVRAAKDYRRAVRRLKKDPDDPDSKYTVGECESFFRSRYFATLADVDPEMMMRRLAEV